MSTMRQTGVGPPLLLLHALGVNSGCWADVTAGLSGYTVLTLEVPGHGSATLTDVELGVHELAESVAAQIRNSAFDRVHVAGMSLGGLVAQDLAAHHPDLVDHLVLIDTVATYPEVVRQQWRDRADIARTSGMASLVAPTLDAWFTADALEAQAPAVVRVRDMITGVDPEGYARACELLERADTRDLLRQIQAPTLVVCGRDDLPAFIAAVPMFEEQITDALPVWIEPGRHAAVLESPEAFMRALRDFLPAGA